MTGSRLAVAVLLDGQVEGVNPVTPELFECRMYRVFTDCCHATILSLVYFGQVPVPIVGTRAAPEIRVGLVALSAGSL
ncbi:hypothetical protein GCM10022265_41180 [Marinobacter xestospongiae]